MKSMTGFGKGAASAPDGGVYSVEISSVNRKQLEIRLQLGAALAEQEAAVRHLVAEKISRGAVSVRADFRVCPESSGRVTVDTELLKELMSGAMSVRRELGLPETELDTASFMLIPGVVRSAEVQLDDEAHLALFNRALAQALENFDRMRSAEGDNLYDYFVQRLKMLREWHGQLRSGVAAMEPECRKRLLDKLAAENLPVAPDDERFLKELVFYLDKSDVTEELTRLNSHFEQFERYIGTDGPSGRSLDFLLQEMFREITTLGNKAGKSGVGEIVVKFKTELEKIREQIQNIE